MKDIPDRSSVQTARNAAVTADVEMLPVVNDAIVEAIAEGSINPGERVFYCKKNFAAQLQTLLQDRFTASGWRLHFSVGDDLRPGTHVYIYGSEARYQYRPPQPDDHRTEPPACFQESRLRRFLKLF